MDYRHPDRLSGRSVDAADIIAAMMPEHEEAVREGYDVEGKVVDTWYIENPVKDGVLPGSLSGR